MSVRETLVFATGMAYTVLWMFDMPLTLKGLLIACVVVSIFLNIPKLSEEKLQSNIDWQLREGCSSGIFCMVLLPLALILSVPLQVDGVISGYGTAISTFCAGLLVTSLVCCGQAVTQSHMEATMPAVIGSVLALAQGIILGCNTISILLAVAALATYSKLQLALPRLFPDSFSLGESVIVAQGTACFVFTFLVRSGCRIGMIPFSTKLDHWNAEVITFVEAAIIGGILVIITLYKVPLLRRYSIGVIVTILGIIGGYAVPYLYLVYGRNPILWLIGYIRKTSISLFIYWSVGCLVATLIVYTCIPENVETDEATDKPSKMRGDKFDSASTEDLHKSSQNGELQYRELPARSSSGSNTEEENEHQVSTIVRKYFHFLAVGLFLPGILLDVQMMLTAASCALVVFAMLEVLRILAVWPVGGLLSWYFRVYTDERDSGYIILTHIYLLVGLAMPLWCYYGSYARGVPPILLSGILSLGVGDTAASIVGSKMGSMYWAGTSKTVEGTVGAVLAQLLAVWLLQRPDLFPYISTSHLFIPIILTSLLEAFTSQIDNLVLPLFMYVMLAGH